MRAARMSKYVLKKLPPHWVFVPSKRQIKELLAELSADVRLVEFSGTGSRHGAGRLYLGIVESRLVDGKWCFCLRLRGVRQSVIDPVREQLTAAAAAEIERYIRKRDGQPPAEIIKPEQLYLSFR